MAARAVTVLVLAAPSTSWRPEVTLVRPRPVTPFTSLDRLGGAVKVAPAPNEVAPPSHVKTKFPVTSPVVARLASHVVADTIQPTATPFRIANRVEMAFLSPVKANYCLRAHVALNLT